MKGFRSLTALLLLLCICCLALPVQAAQTDPADEAQAVIDWLDAYGVLPDYFITKQQARDFGWDSKKNYVSDVAPGCSIGGDTFGNREKLLPEAKGRSWHECDIGYVQGKRTTIRLVWSTDGLYYYTDDNYKSFTQMYPTGTAPPEEEAGPIIEAQAIADYIFANGCLPSNFITKRQAQDLGWDSSRNYVSDVAPGYSIGGDRFGNYEGKLPTKKGRQYYECDVNYTKGKRSALRIIFSNDGLVYYTEDHYNTFTQMFPSGK